MNLEFLGIKSHTVPVDSIGDVLNYSLRQIAGEDSYKHGFLIIYPKTMAAAIALPIDIPDEIPPI